MTQRFPKGSWTGFYSLVTFHRNRDSWISTLDVRSIYGEHKSNWFIDMTYSVEFFVIRSERINFRLLTFPNFSSILINELPSMPTDLAFSFVKWKTTYLLAFYHVFVNGKKKWDLRRSWKKNWVGGSCSESWLEGKTEIRNENVADGRNGTREKPRMNWKVIKNLRWINNSV